MSARTESDIFGTFRTAHGADGFRWREWWRRYWMDHLSDYFERGWHLVPCGKWSKRPLAGFEWSKRYLGFEEAVWYVAQGHNLAVVAEDLVILDMDSDSVRPFETGTLTMRTPKGYQYWCSRPFTMTEVNRVKQLGFDTPRSGQMFSLVPLSRTCRYDKGGRCGCVVHDFRIREWINFGAECKPIKQVLREIS